MLFYAGIVDARVDSIVVEEKHTVATPDRHRWTTEVGPVAAWYFSGWLTHKANGELPGVMTTCLCEPLGHTSIAFEKPSVEGYWLTHCLEPAGHSHGVAIRAARRDQIAADDGVPCRL